MKPSWQNAPEWANWLAMDEDSGWYWYEYVPLKMDVDGEYFWGPTTESFAYAGFGSADDIYFADSIEQRP